MAKIICGVDVSADRLNARIGAQGPALEVERSPQGVAELAGFCTDNGAELVVMEATGGYERLVFALLWQAGLPCAVVNPRAVRRFAEAMGVLEKTDAIDAGVIADYAAARRLVPQTPASAAQQRLAALLTRLQQLTQTRLGQLNQRRLIEEPQVLASIDELLVVLKRQIKAFELEITALLGSDPLWRELDHAFRRIVGVSDRTVAGLLAELPEIGTLSGKAVAKLIGLAPLARDSGKHAGKRSIRGGRAPLRALLFVVALGVARHNPHFANFRARLMAAGKPKMAIRVALARKLLVCLNAKARDVRIAFTPS